MKGDRVEIVIDSGEGTRNYEVTASRAGRRVEIANRRGIIEVSEVRRVIASRSSSIPARGRATTR